MKNGKLNTIERLIFYGIVFLIFQEWLKPIVMLTSTGHFALISFFVMLCLAISLLRIPIVISWVLKIGYMLWFIVHVYSDVPLLSSAGVQFLSGELRVNVDMLLQGQGSQVTNPLRTSLFFVLIWMLVYLIQHWITVRMTVFYFFVLTVFFIATLDTFSEYDGSSAIVKVVLLGLIMTALLFMRRLVTATGAVMEWRKYVVYIAPVIIFIGLAGILAIVLPKAEPQWPDPVPYIKTATGQGGASGIGNGPTISRVGYGDNDARLGGPFLADDTVVFEMDVQSKQYWRVETKDMYTSRGWQNSNATNVIMNLQVDEPFPYLVTTGMEETQTAKVRSFNDFTFIVQPYQTEAVGFDGNQYPNLLFHLNLTTEKVSSLSNGQPVMLDNYQVTFREPEYSYTVLKESMMSTEADMRFLQLPDTLPERVVELAHEITANAESVYDKARAVESYFRRNAFKYKTEDVPVPEVGQDYVDQFLFETKYGYCDNFSTSMVVLLRSVGIQARWVKGFASGEQVAIDEGLRTFEITNNDAHSWVEAYIDGIGWIPFEPTVGFSNPVNIDYDMETDSADEDREQPKQQEKLDKPELPEKQVNAAGGKFNIAKYKWLFYLLLGFVLVTAFYLWKKRGKWQPKLAVKMQQGKPANATNFESSYEVLLKQLARAGVKRMPHQTLQQYAEKVDAQYETTKMTELTSAYEKIIYGAHVEAIDFDEMKESWEYLINRTSG